MNTPATYDAARLGLMLNELRLPTIGRLWPEFAQRSDKEGWQAARLLGALLEHELAERVKRRIERHRIESHLARFIDACDPLAISQWVSGHPRARQAFTDMLWARAVEPGIEERRWPDRRPPSKIAGQLAEAVQADCQVRGADLADAGTRHWLAGHAARLSLGAVWCDAQARTTAAVRSGVAAWADTASDMSWRDSAWLARVTPSGVGFASPVPADWTAAAPTDKAMRRLACAARAQARRDTMWTASRGACLTWSDETGWEVVEAIAPADCDVRRRRLLGLQAGRPWCWLYRAVDGGFVARWDHAPLQVRAATPGAAIAGLRQGATTCQRTGQVALALGPSPLAVTPQRSATAAAADYQTFVAVVRCRNGFWQEANELIEAARCYQRACVLPVPARGGG